MVRGRAADRINRGGEKVSAEQVEEHLLAHPAVRDAIVVAASDTYLGERTCAYVVPVDTDDPPTLAGLRAFVRNSGLAEWKLPDAIEVIEAFPETGWVRSAERSCGSCSPADRAGQDTGIAVGRSPRTRTSERRTTAQISDRTSSVSPK